MFLYWWRLCGCEPAYRVHTDSPGANLDSRRLARRANHRDVLCKTPGGRSPGRRTGTSLHIGYEHIPAEPLEFRNITYADSRNIIVIFFEVTHIFEVEIFDVYPQAIR